MGNSHSKLIRTKGGEAVRTAVPQNSNQEADQQLKAPNPITPCPTRRHTSGHRRASSSSHRHHKKVKPSSRITVHRDLATATTILSRYANRHAIETVLKEILGESLIRTADGISTQQWRVEETDDDIKRIHAHRELTKVEQQAIYKETHRSRREGTKYHESVQEPDY